MYATRRHEVVNREHNQQKQQNCRNWNGYAQTLKARDRGQDNDDRGHYHEPLVPIGLAPHPDASGNERGEQCEAYQVSNDDELRLSRVQAGSGECRRSAHNHNRTDQNDQDSYDCSQEAEATMEVGSMCGNETRLNEHKGEPSRQNDAMQVEINRDWRNIEQTSQVESARKADQNRSEQRSRHPEKEPSRPPASSGWTCLLGFLMGTKRLSHRTFKSTSLSAISTKRV